jgi:CRP-like cAMP-binding protein
MAEGTVHPGKNRLLESLDAATRKFLLPQLTLVELGIRQYVYEPNRPIQNVYFPIDGVISLLAPPELGSSIEVATIGNEGFAGLPIFLGANQSPGSCFSQVPGRALRMRAANFRSAVERNGDLTRVLHLYTSALMVQISQGTACNRAHSIQQRCARWLLLTHDRVGKDEFLLTQEFLAQMLGVRRASVGDIAMGLQKRKLIRYSRGRIHVMNRRGLEALSCICYSIIRKEYDRLLTRTL